VSKRRLSKQQLKRIQEKQLAKQQALQESRDESILGQPERGLVITRFSNQALIEDENQQVIKCAIRQNLGHICAGDAVVFQSDGHKHHVVTAVMERKNVLGRVDKRGTLRPQACNIDQMYVVLAAKPEPSLLLLDSYLVASFVLNIHPIIVYNKADIVDIPAELAIYRELGYDLLVTSATNNIGLGELDKMSQDNTSVFVGQSGVGKSSLISTLLPDIEVKSQAISEQSELGKHTTSNSVLYHLDGGGHIIDSPGIREFSLWQVSNEELLSAYTEFRPFIGRCKYSNCTHLNEPHCAFIEAAKAKQISVQRLDRFQKLKQKYTDS